MSKVLFSVVCPVYNSEEFIAATLESVMAQEMLPDEIVLVDDGSTDNTVAVIHEIKSSAPVEINVIKGRHAGPGAARNLGINAARNDWIAFIDSDDLWEADKLVVVSECIEANPDHNIFCHGEYHVTSGGDSTVVDYGKSYDYGKDLSSQLYLRNFFSTSAVVCRKELILKVHGFDEQMMNAQDYDLWLKMSPDATPYFISQCLGKYRIRDGNITSRSVEQKFVNLFKIAWRYRGYVRYHIRWIKLGKMVLSYIKQKINRVIK